MTTQSRSFISRLRRSNLSTTAQVALILYAVNLIFASGVFFLNLSEINPWDEAAFLNSGRALWAGQLTSFAGNPLTQLFFGLTYLPFAASDFWMLHSLTLGRFVMFSLLWLSMYLVASRLDEYAHPIIALGFLSVAPLSLAFLRFPSDPLFTAFAALSLWQLLSYRADAARSHLWAASALMGLAALARNDGLALFVILLLSAALLSFRSPDRWRALLAVCVPFLVIVLGYVLLFGLTTGDFSLGTAARTYDNFETGHLAIYSGPGDQNATVEARLEARRVFGTPEENDFNVLRAISRNPGVYLQRVIAVGKELPGGLLDAYGIRFAALILVLGLRGVVELLRRREYTLLTVLLIWPAHLASGFVITIFRQGHLQLPFYVVFALAAIGLAAVIRRFDERTERVIWTVVLLGLILYGYVDNKLAILYGAGVLLIGLWIGVYAWRRLADRNSAFVVALLILLSGGIVLRGGFPSPRLRPLGVEAKEQAALAMIESLEPETLVAAGSPGVVYLTRMRYAGLSSDDVPTTGSDQDFLRWMIDGGIEAIYVDQTLYNDNPAIWALIQPQIGDGLERIYQGDDGDIQVLLVKGSP